MGDFIFIIVVVVIGISILVSQIFSKKAIIKRKLKKAPYKKLSQFKDGDIAIIIGKVEFAEQPLTAPLSGRKCAYYHVKVEERKSSGKNSHWETVIDHDDSIKYLIREDKQYAIIDDYHQKSYIVHDKNFSSGFLNDASPELERFLNEWQYESEGFLGFNKSLKYKEGVLEKNEEVAVLGKGTWVNASEFGLPEELGKILAIKGIDQSYVYLSDDPDTMTKNVMTTQQNKVEQRKSFDRKSTYNRKHRYNREESKYSR